MSQNKRKVPAARTTYVWLAVCSLAIGIPALYYQRAAPGAPSPVERCKLMHKPQQPPKKPASNIIGMQ
jgi:hypothetical protein